MCDTLEAKTLNYHSNAAALIIAAAKKSGLLKDVAEALYAFDNHYEPESGVCCNFNCGPCELLRDLQRVPIIVVRTPNV